MKRILICILSSMIIIVCTSCTALLSTTQTYLAAFGSTNNADSFQSRTKLKLSLDLSKLPDNTRKDLEIFKEVKINIDEMIDNKNNKGQIDIFIALGEIPLNVRVYLNNNKTYIRDGKKYVLTTSGGYGETFKDKEKSFGSYSKFYKDIKNIWVHSVEKEILAKEHSTIVYTPDGDMKVTQLSLELTDKKIRNILIKLAESISKNEDIKKAIIESSMPYRPEAANRTEYVSEIRNFLNILPEKITKSKDKFGINKLKLTARIDKDSYIIDQTVAGKLFLKIKDANIGISFDAKTTKWDFNRKIKIDIPKMNKKDIKPIESYNMSNFAKDFQEAIKNN
ncbi:MAG TPA: hypothetical protein VHT34_00790 [Clostridia bacterium]|nr:hypothetical protein [Clostridia bacterium]